MKTASLLMGCECTECSWCHCFWCWCHFGKWHPDSELGTIIAPCGIFLGHFGTQIGAIILAPSWCHIMYC